MTTLNDLVRVTLVADANTPTPPPAPAGTIVALMPGQTPPARPDDFFGVPGWRRQVANGWEWVMTGPTDVAAQFVDNTVAAASGGWYVPAARNTWLQFVRDLQALGVTNSTIVNRVPPLYAAAVTNHLAKP